MCESNWHENGRPSQKQGEKVNKKDCGILFLP